MKFALSAPFLAFLAGYTLSQFYRTFLAVIAPEIAAELHLSPADLGAMSGAWFAFFAFTQFPLGAALDRYGPRRTVPLFMAMGSAGAALFSLGHSADVLILAMGLIGIGCAPALMGSLYVFGRIYEPGRFAYLSSMMVGLGSIGNLLGGTPLAYAAKIYGWRGVMVGLAVLSLLASLGIARFVKDPPRVAPPSHEVDNGWSASIGKLLRVRALWPVWPMMAVGYATLIAERGLWVGPFLSDVYGLDSVARGDRILLMAAAITVGALAYGPLEQRLKTRKWLVWPGTLATGLGFLALALWPDQPLWSTTLFLCVIGAAGMTFAVVMAHVRSFVPDHLLGRGITFANFLCMGSAGMMQTFSGRYVHALKSIETAPIDIYARLHGIFALILLTATAIYTLSRDHD
jgi:MFS family permease